MERRAAGSQHRAFASCIAARSRCKQLSPDALTVDAVRAAHLEKPDAGFEQGLAALRIACMDLSIFISLPQN